MTVGDSSPPPRAGGPRIPTPPPAAARRARRGDRRVVIWLTAFALGLGIGVAAYQWAPLVDDYFDALVAGALG